MSEQSHRSPENQKRYNERKKTQLDRVALNLIDRTAVVANEAAEPNSNWDGDVVKGSGGVRISTPDGHEINTDYLAHLSVEKHVPVVRDKTPQHDKVYQRIQRDGDDDGIRFIAHKSVKKNAISESRRLSHQSVTTQSPQGRHYDDHLAVYAKHGHLKNFESDQMSDPLHRDYPLSDAQTDQVNASILNSIRGELSGVRHDIKVANQEVVQQHVDDILKA